MYRLRMSILVILLLMASAVSVKADNFIKGPPEFQQHVNAALSFAKNSDPEDYRQTIRYISLIEQNEKSWSWIIGYDGLCKVELSSAYVNWGYDNLYQLSGDLIHEGSLCHDYFSGNTKDVKADEMKALLVQRKFYIRSGAPQYLVDYMDSLIKSDWPWGK